MIPVHPHGCGENGCLNRLSGETKRFTPTGVGKTWLSSYTSFDTSVHPHGCGENARGSNIHIGLTRFTPTGVGKTFPPPPSVDPPPGSPPRVWGKLNGRLPGFPWSFGSPPRVWGKPLTAACLIVAARFTPTGVGKTLAGRYTPHETTVHPHGCGENGGYPHPTRSIYGSPPRVWGKHDTPASTRRSKPVHPHGCGENELQAKTAFYGMRFTPTGVGKTPPFPLQLPATARFTPTGVGKTRQSGLDGMK